MIYKISLIKPLLGALTSIFSQHNKIITK